MLATAFKKMATTGPADGLARLRRALTTLRPAASAAMAATLDKLASDADATQFHADGARDAERGRPTLVVLLGGTGTGKSTLANRLCNAADHGELALTATSFRRTFTAGAVAVARDAAAVPAKWLGVVHKTATETPARGTLDELLVVSHDSALTEGATLVDTPDLDGDTPRHHEQADRAFRWAEAVVFVTTPEKYQMTELAAYYRLCGRYAVPAIYAMNKVDDLAAADDWRSQLREFGVDGATVYVVPRDDAGFTAPPERDLDALRSAVAALPLPTQEERRNGAAARMTDLAGRVADQVLAPLQQRRRSADAVKGRLAALVRPEPGVDVHSMTRSLQRRLQQQSVLYMMGPGRVIDRVKSVPSLVARLPRSAWDLLTRGSTSVPEPTAADPVPVVAPDFRSELMDGLLVVQSRISDLMSEAKFSADPDGESADWRLSPTDAGDIATAELDELRRWLEERWNGKPRDTRTLQTLVSKLPGGKHLPKLSEAAPYLLTATCAVTNSLFGPVDQVIIGGFLLTTWLTEKLSNEVAAKTRETNKRIERRFNDLCERQVEQATAYLDRHAPSGAQLKELEAALDALPVGGEAGV